MNCYTFDVHLNQQVYLKTPKQLAVWNLPCQGKPSVIRRSLLLKPSIFSNTAAAAADDDANNNGLGLITVTAIFRPEPSVGHASKWCWSVGAASYESNIYCRC